MLAAYTLYIATGAGVTIGAHRFFTHRSFKAKFPLRCLMAAVFTMSGEVSALRMLGSALIAVQMSSFKIVYKISYYNKALIFTSCCLTYYASSKIVFYIFRANNTILRCQIFRFKRTISCSTYFVHLQVVMSTTLT